MSTKISLQQRTSDQALQEWYTTTLKPDLEKTEQQRVRTLGWVYLAFAVAGLALLPILFLDELQGWLELAAKGGFIAGAATGGLLLQRLRNQLKQSLVTNVCTYLGMTHTAKPDHYPLDSFVRAGILPANYQRARLEDKITGCHDGVKFSLCETRLSTTRIKDQNQGTTRTHTLFQGILLQFSFNKSFTGHTRILAKTGRISSLLSLEQIEPSQRGEPVFLEDPRFNELFTVYSTDQIEARYLLTPGFMERLLELDELLGDTRRGKGSNLYAGFIGGNLLIAIRTTQNRFEGGSLFENVVQFTRVEDLLKEIRLIHATIETLNLENTSQV
ncbi:MAG: DUF3137 domain-containing protein [Gammaproteobacteria bacterium]|nr:DUF3137 domain-containing protein [Gammaproteobacteria bacterium]